ncbi:hypothetical protein C0991_000718 [Blastosporella zonata]|nr:hypothetical protein C0991_000718 [Blastosporella zonata]
MPAFQPLGAKRKSEYEDEPARKRPAFDTGSSSGAEEYWMFTAANNEALSERLCAGKVTWPLEEGKAFSFSNKDIELDRPLTRNEYLSGQAFGSSSTTSDTPPTTILKEPTKQFVALKISGPATKTTIHTSKPSAPLQPVDTISVSDNGPKSAGDNTHWTANCQIKASQLPDLIGMPEGSGGDEVDAGDDSHTPVAPSDKFVEQVAKFVAPTSFYGTHIKSKPKGALHDPDAENAVVMKAPTKEHIKKFNKK